MDIFTKKDRGKKLDETNLTVIVKALHYRQKINLKNTKNQTTKTKTQTKKSQNTE